MDEFQVTSDKIRKWSSSTHEFKFGDSSHVVLVVGYQGKKISIHYRYNLLSGKDEISYNFLFLKIKDGLATYLSCGKYEYRDGDWIVNQRVYTIKEGNIKACVETREERRKKSYEGRDNISPLELGVDIRDSFSHLPMFKVTLSEWKVKVFQLIEV